MPVNILCLCNVHLVLIHGCKTNGITDLTHPSLSVNCLASWLILNARFAVNVNVEQHKPFFQISESFQFYEQPMEKMKQHLIVLCAQRDVASSSPEVFHNNACRPA